ncbi:protein jim lovell [Pseudomyrmex gracilis]|uniref:protein jim lovell n=1 Tax=Pseudomyrmex gracilis TaxID=219809 RepID=UPI000994C40E|nr:protein jim lovell [Pseudomyrmex gracilis]
MSSVGDSPDIMQSHEHYSLRWNNHQNHILQTFEELLEEESYVDVTLICAETSLKAHKVVLGACSPFFRRIFAEHPCKHPLIVLKDFTGAEINALIIFMYRGEVKVAQEELPGLMKAAECLQVRGLAASEPRPVSAEPRQSPLCTMHDLLSESLTPEVARPVTPEEDENAIETSREMPPMLFQPTRDQAKVPLISNMSFGIRDSCGSPLPRRKQARPRRRSGELPQDLSRRSSPLTSSSPCPNVLNLSGSNSQYQVQQHQQSQHQQLHQQQQQHHQQSLNNTQSQQQHQQQQHQHQQEDVAENLSVKKPASPSDLDQHHVKTESSEATSSPRGSPLTGTSLLHSDGPVQDISNAAAAVAAAVATVIPTKIPTMSTLSLPQSHPSEYLNLGLARQWPGHPQSQLPPPPLQAHHPREDSPHGPGNPSSHPYQQQQRDSPMHMRRSSLAAMFNPTSLDTLSSGIFSHVTYDRGNLITDTLLQENFKSETIQNLFSTSNFNPTKKTKKHRNDADAPRRWNDHTRSLGNRPKGQHSAPRGGPPRSWTNNELTMALQHVWEKKLTTSQASRMFGIPYNSLLMYVRGKYGKSLKLEQLRRDCIGANNPEIMNNNNVKSIQQSAQMSHALTTGLPLQHPGDNAGFGPHSLLGGNLPQPQGFYPADFATASFPMPVNMVHLLPPSEQKSFEPTVNSSGDSGGSGGVGGSAAGGGDGNSGNGGDLTNSQTSETPSPIVDHHLHHHESSMQPQPPQSMPALLQQNGSD